MSEVRPVKCRLRSVECTLWSVKWKVWNVKCNVSSVKCGVSSVKFWEWSAQFNVQSVECPKDYKTMCMLGKTTFHTQTYLHQTLPLPPKRALSRCSTRNMEIASCQHFRPLWQRVKAKTPVMRPPRTVQLSFWKRRKSIAPVIENYFRQHMMTRGNATMCHTCHAKQQ